MQVHSVGIDLGKSTFHLVALGASGKVQWNSEDERTVKTACLNSDVTLAFTAVRLVSTGTRGTHRGRENHLHLKAGYIEADCSARTQCPLHPCGGPYTVSRYPMLRWRLEKETLARSRY
jgi:hypothetical protein